MVLLAVLVLWLSYRGVAAMVTKVRAARRPRPLEPASIPSWHPESLP